MEETTTDTVEVPSSPEDAEHRKLFYEAVNKHLSGKDDSAKPFSDEAYQLRFDILKKAKEGVNLTALKKISAQAAKFKAKFDIISVGSISKLVYKEKADSNGVLPPIENYKEVSHYSAIFDAIKKEHLPMHRKRLSLFEEVKSKFADSIPLWACVAFCNLCPVCVRRQHKKKPKAGHQPIVTPGYGTRGQIDLIDFQMMPDGPYNFLLNYEDHGIKFNSMEPLALKTCRGVAWILFNLFTLIGAPKIIQSDNGREFNRIACGGKARQVFLDDAVSFQGSTSFSCSLISWLMYFLTVFCSVY